MSEPNPTSPTAEIEVRDGSWKPHKITCRALAEWIADQAINDRNGLIQRVAEAIEADRKVTRLHATLSPVPAGGGEAIQSSDSRSFIGYLPSGESEPLVTTLTDQLSETSAPPAGDVVRHKDMLRAYNEFYAEPFPTSFKAFERAINTALAALPAQQGAAHAEPVAWRCGARAGFIEPTDCNWPDCGCDPHVERVVDGLREGGWTVERPLYTSSPTVEGWRDISSAPRVHRQRIIVFRRGAKRYPVVGEDYWSDKYQNGCWALSPADEQPTHWQPLPSAPVPEGRE